MSAGESDSSRSSDALPPPHHNLTGSDHGARLSIPPAFRLPLASFLSFCVGMGLGSMHGSNMAGLRFRAEHSHKLPTSMTGWYLYYKTKNYHAAYGGIREGLRMGARISFWTTTMFALEELLDNARATKDLVNTVLACVTVAGSFSLSNRLSLPLAAQTTKRALTVGIIYGGLQDLVGLARGRSIGYVDYIKSQLMGRPAAGRSGGRGLG